MKHDLLCGQDSWLQGSAKQSSWPHCTGLVHKDLNSPLSSSQQPAEGSCGLRQCLQDRRDKSGMLPRHPCHLTPSNAPEAQQVPGDCGRSWLQGHCPGLGIIPITCGSEGQWGTLSRMDTLLGTELEAVEKMAEC